MRLESKLCRILKLSTSAYYRWEKRNGSVDAEYLRLCSEVKAIDLETKHGYGSRRISQELRRRGYDVGRFKAATLMKASNVVAIVTKRHHYPDAGVTDTIAPNHLNREFEVSQPNTVWAGDITYIATQQEWLYLAVVIDLYSRRVVGWASSSSPDTGLVIRALRLALQTRSPAKGLMFHSDQGCQYTSKDFRDYLALKKDKAAHESSRKLLGQLGGRAFFQELENRENTVRAVPQPCTGKG
ncbi:MAG: IS3 family transposase [bacterium]